MENRLNFLSFAKKNKEANSLDNTNVEKKEIRKKLNKEAFGENKNIEKLDEEISLDEKEKQLIEKEVKMLATDELNKRNLPVKLLELLDYSSKKEMFSSLDNLEFCFREALNEKVDSLIKVNLPKKAYKKANIADDDIKKWMGLD